MIQLRYQQPTLWAGFWGEEVEDLWEPWMRAVDRVLEDEELLDRVYEAQAERHEQSRSNGRPQTPAEVVLRLLILKHVRNWSYETLEREVRANLVYRAFTRIGTEKVPDAKTLGRLGQALGAEVIEQIHQRVVELAQEHGVVQGRKMRVDTTVVETNIHYPTDSSLLGDGARVLTRTLKKIERRPGALKTRVRNRLRSVKKWVVAIALSSRQKGPPAEQRRQGLYRRLITVTRKIVHQAKRVMEEVDAFGGRRRARLHRVRELLGTMVERTQQVVRQSRARIFRGVTQFPNKLVSLFEPYTEMIRKGKLAQPTEFGKLVRVQEAENQIVTHYEVLPQRRNDTELLVGAVEEQRRRLGRVPRLVAADAGFYTRENEETLAELGVHRVAIPNRKSRSEERRRFQKQRWFRAGQRWRTGSEGRISVLKRRHGLDRCRYRGFQGMQRWVGLGIIADNLIHIGRCLALRGT